MKPMNKKDVEHKINTTKKGFWYNKIHWDINYHDFVYIILFVARTQLLAMFFSPRVVYFIVITIIFCIAGGIGIAVYVFKR